MSGTKRTEPTFQRNALAPALLAAAVLFLAPVLLTAGWGIVVLFVVAILALIVLTAAAMTHFDAREAWQRVTWADGRPPPAPALVARRASTAPKSLRSRMGSSMRRL